jgi:alkylated DNA repair protein (DNA oxidative demethylase)
MLAVAPDVFLWRTYFSRQEQTALLSDILKLTEAAPFYRPVMPGSGKPFSVMETNFGPLGWIADKNGYRYTPYHPTTGAPWPDIPERLLNLWSQLGAYSQPPECCLVNLYRGPARMGLHQDKNETALGAAVVSVSLGDDAVFRIGGPSRYAPTKSLILHSGDVLTFGGIARLAFHGIDRVRQGSSQLIPGGGRINLTLRRVY